MAAPLRKVKKTRLHEEVMVELAAYIRGGKFKPGDQLPPERELAERMQVSRATIREALRMMELQSLIVSHHGSGNFIAEGNAGSLAKAMTQFALQDILEGRLIFDPSIAALAARRATPEDIGKLKSILKQQEKNMHEDRDGATTDTHFHSAIAEATHNRALIRIAQALIEVFAPSRGTFLQSRKRAIQSLSFHKRILEAIEAHSPENARRTMAEHVESVGKELTGANP